MTQTTLLLVDDDPMVVESLAPLLERSGFHVLIASNGDEALSKVRSHHPDVIVMDVLMPRVNGREALRRMRKSNIWTPTILLTQVGEAAERAIRDHRPDVVVHLAGLVGGILPNRERPQLEETQSLESMKRSSWLQSWHCSLIASVRSGMLQRA